jgi:Amt family ammonium transporter
MIIEWVKEGKPKFIGLLTGAVAGLATITPAAGFVPLWAAMLIGISAGAICFYAVQLKNKLGWDDALDVWGVHGVGGCLGTILLGVFAYSHINGQSGLLEGNVSFFLKEVAAVAIAAVYAYGFTYLMLILINLISPVKATEEEENLGIDQALHGEKAYDEGSL